MGSYLLPDIDVLFKQGFFSNLDYHFAKSMGGIFAGTDPVVLFSCALVSKHLSQGHICVDISKIAGTAIQISETGNLKLKYPEFDVWHAALTRSDMVSDAADTPLVMDADSRLFLAKYFDFKERLAKNIVQRHTLAPVHMDSSFIDQQLEAVFDPADPRVLPQITCIKSALNKHFTVISGGPGTGKTFVTGLIRQMFEFWSVFQKLGAPRVLCVAPTGKAASKMDQGKTIHSVLKPRKNKTGFYHCAKRPLTADMVIIDEASMIDIVLMTRLFEAIPMTAKIILLGDRHQLASVQAGAVFSEICKTKALESDIHVLEYNFRSKSRSGIETLAKAINHMDADHVEDILLSASFPDIVFENLVEKSIFYESLNWHISEGFKAFCMAQSVESALTGLDDFKILCAHNSGEFGTLQINHLCEKILRSMTDSGIKKNIFKQMVMVTVNDYSKELFNGDTGILTRDEQGDIAWFLTRDGNRHFRRVDLPEHETAFAITIHKSQGSEFDTVLIIIPDRLSQVLTQQLLYTGVTRTRSKVIIAGDINIIKKAVGLC
ncbi:MAG: exodeoxyribonuclease V subunit alpha, partial [Proteobacteria bacterium]|nr:exodeoxyribonuclease V subunit alpha [Pseudomonadota bacterium]